MVHDPKRTLLRPGHAFWRALTTMVCIGAANVSLAKDNKYVCPPAAPAPAKISRSKVYEGVPFQAGEKSQFELRFYGALVGYASIEVKNPIKHQGMWHRRFSAEARTGDWYKLIFVAHNKIQAVSRPWDFAISKFYLEQDEGKMFGKRFQQKKWLEFDHDHCVVHEKIQVPDKKAKLKDNVLQRGAIDSLGAIFRLRTLDYQLDKTRRELVYTSEKNWWLEATPVAFEKITVPAGTFDAVKLKLQTFVGKDLQQKGDLFAWIDQKTPDKPLLQLEGEVKVGSVSWKLVKYKSGRK